MFFEDEDTTAEVETGAAGTEEKEEGEGAEGTETEGGDTEAGV